MVMQNKIRDAMKTYRTAMKLDETSVPALTGNLKKVYMFLFHKRIIECMYVMC